MRNVDHSQATKFYGVLRDHLLQSSEGQQVITAFESDPEEETATLAQYLREHLHQDEALADQLAEALGEGNQLATVVTGGQVDQIINIARLGVLNLHLTQKKYLSIFRDVKQLLIFISIVLLVAAGVTYSVWLSNQPRRLDGEFNIAVAEFIEKPVTKNPETAPGISQNLYSFLDREYESFEADVQVTHDKIGEISEFEQATEMAEKVNAHLVIYGTVIKFGGNGIEITLRFYVADTFHSDVGEISGEHDFSYIVFTEEDLGHYDSNVREFLRDRSRLLTEFTKVLVYFAADDLDAARTGIEETIKIADDYGEFEGKEVLHLFGSTITRLLDDFEASRYHVDKALELNDSYGRGYIALANIFYDQQDFATALDYYNQATKLKGQPQGAYIIEKANAGAGNISNYLYQVADASNKQALANETLSYFQVVIDSYDSANPRVKERLREITAWAYYGSGIIHQGEGNQIEAVRAYQQVLKLTQDLGLKERAENRMNEVR